MRVSVALGLPFRSSHGSPCRGTGLALRVRPGVRASASAALTQALLKGVQRLGSERITSAARARPPEVAPALCPGTAPEQAAPSGAPRTASHSAPLHAHRPGHVTSAISAAQSERRRAGHAPRKLRGAPAARPGLTRAAQPGASEGSEGSIEQRERPRMHERVAHASGAKHKHAATHLHERGAHGWGAAVPGTERRT